MHLLRGGSVVLAALAAGLLAFSAQATATGSDPCVPDGAVVIQQTGEVVLWSRERDGYLDVYGCLRSVGTPHQVSWTSTVVDPQVLGTAISGRYAAAVMTARDGERDGVFGVVDLTDGVQQMEGAAQAISGLASSGGRVAIALTFHGRSSVWESEPNRRRLVAAAGDPITDLTLNGRRLAYRSAGRLRSGTLHDPHRVHVHVTPASVRPRGRVRVRFRETDPATVGRGFYNVWTDTLFAQASSAQRPCSKVGSAFLQTPQQGIFSALLQTRGPWCAGVRHGTVMYFGGTFDAAHCPDGRFGCGIEAQVGTFTVRVR